MEINQQFQNALLNEPITLCLQDSALRYLWVHNLHPAWKGLDLVGLTDDSLGSLESHALSRFVDTKLRALATGDKQLLEEWVTGLDGCRYFFKLTVDLYELPDGTPGLLSKFYDLTREKQTEVRLEQAIADLNGKNLELEEVERRFRLSLEDERVVIFIQDTDFRNVWVFNNMPSWDMELTGRTMQEVMANSAEVAHRLRVLKQRVLETGQAERTQTWVLDPAGQPIYVKLGYYPYTLPDGSPGLLGKSFDVTDQKLAEQRLEALNRQLNQTVDEVRLSEAKLQAAITDKSIAVFVQDSDLRYSWISISQEGWDGAAMIGKTDMELMPDKEQAARMLEVKREVIRSGQPYEFATWVNPPLKPEIRHFWNGQYAPYTFPDGSKGIVGRFMDITSLRLAQDELERVNRQFGEANQELVAKVVQLKESEAKLQAALGNDVLASVQDKDLRFIWVSLNQQGWEEERFLGKTDEEALADPEEGRQVMALKRQIIESGRPFEFSQWLTGSDGVRRFQQGLLRPYPMPDGTTGIIGRVIDMTDARLAQEKVEELNRELATKLTALETLERELGLALEGEPIILFIADSELRYVWAYNLPKGLDVVGKTDLEVHPDPEAAHITMAAKRRTIETGQRQITEGWTTDKLGRHVYRRSIYDPYTLEDGSLGVIGKHYDLTESKNIEQELQYVNEQLQQKVKALTESDEKLNAALDGVPITLAILDENLRYIWARNNLPDKFTTTQNLGNDPSTQLKDEDAIYLNEVKMRVRDTGKTERLDYWLTTRTGHRTFLKLTYSPYPLPNGKTGIIAKGFDLTDLQLSQEKIQELNSELEKQVRELQFSEEKLAAAVSIPTLSLVLLDKDLRYVWTTVQQEGWAPDVILGKTDEEFILEPEIARQMMEIKREVLRTGIPAEWSDWLAAPLDPKRKHYWRGTYSPFKFADGSVGIIGRFTDITDVKKAEEETKALNKALD